MIVFCPEVLAILSQRLVFVPAMNFQKLLAAKGFIFVAEDGVNHDL